MVTCSNFLINELNLQIEDLFMYFTVRQLQFLSPAYHVAEIPYLQRNNRRLSIKLKKNPDLGKILYQQQNNRNTVSKIPWQTAHGCYWTYVTMNIKQILHFFLLPVYWMPWVCFMRQQNVFASIRTEREHKIPVRGKARDLYSLFDSLLLPHNFAGDLTAINTQSSQNFLAKCFTEWFLTAKFVRFS